jgi:hypothetical protein
MGFATRFAPYSEHHFAEVRCRVNRPFTPKVNVPRLAVAAMRLPAMTGTRATQRIDVRLPACDANWEMIVGT